MSVTKGVCPLTMRQIVDEYFIENRTKLLDIAAFLDRIERSSDQEDPSKDFRLRVFRKALDILSEDGQSRVLRMQMLLSDPTTAPRTVLDQKSAKGAWDDQEAAR
ncbi:MAG: hypothetical protein IT161_04400 [Bryobacterales bacterium]|nr:hypothetical protein [Bryobacterales bacterium]